MTSKVLIEVDAKHAAIVRRALALTEEVGHIQTANGLELRLTLAAQSWYLAVYLPEIVPTSSAHRQGSHFTP
jgi:hypothetical protein